MIGGIYLNEYEKLLQKAYDDKARVFENFDLNGDDDQSERIDGIYIDGNIAIDKKVDTTIEKSCVIAEELGHHHTSTGNILDQSDAANRKQEYRARLAGYNLRVGLIGLIQAYENKCQNEYEVAEYLRITVDYLRAVIECYRKKYGQCVVVDNYIIGFEPVLAIAKMN